MGVLAAMTAEPAAYRYREKEYKVSPWTVEVMAAFERHVEGKAMEAYEKVASRLQPAAAERALSTLMQDLTACAYTFGTPFMGKALQAPEHVEYMFFLCLKKNHPEVTRQLVKEMAKDDYDGIVKVMNVANQDPNSPAPAEVGEKPPATE